MSVGQGVKRYRELLRMNQRQLAERSGLSQATVSRIEGGQVKNPKFEALGKLATALRVTVDDLVRGPFGPRVGPVSVDHLPDVPVDDAVEILSRYMRLSPRGRDQIRLLLHVLDEHERRERLSKTGGENNAG